ncbi:hypothetical protein MUP05_03320 [Candidatus Bathyarchaeota archaeon]|nr:hypothetical protein [Candidatus Bathyarchaeota archaeon]
MSGQSRWKLLGVVIVASALLGVVGWQQFLPQPKAPTTVTITPWTTTASATQTTVGPQRQIEWIRIGEVKTINYYLSLLESNGTQPYVQLAKELRKLPDLTNATAVAKIAYLALNATNPEVKEAFELMMKGGAPDPRDFGYIVPSWNTELEALYSLASQNEFERDDTMAVAIAMVNGLWITMGDDQVRRQVKVDGNAMLNLAREITEWQWSNGHSTLRHLPFEAQLNWAWRGSENIGYKLIYLRDQGRRVDEATYYSIAVSISTLREMRQFVTNEWLSRDVDRTIKNMENLYVKYTADGTRYSPAWFSDPDQKYRNINNANLVWEYFKANGKGIGVCTDEATFVDALAKSVGIATIPIEVGGIRKDNAKIEAHAFVLYYNPDSKLWKSYQDQVTVVSTAYNPPYWIDVYLPPVQQSELLWSRSPPKEFPMFVVAGYRPTLVGISGVKFLVDGMSGSSFRNDVVLPFYLERKYIITWT